MMGIWRELFVCLWRVGEWGMGGSLGVGRGCAASLETGKRLVVAMDGQK